MRHGPRVWTGRRGLEAGLSRRPGEPSFARPLAIIAVSALALRLLYILVIAPAPAGIGGDAGFYHSAANLIAHGHFYYRGIFGHAYKTAEHPPLYPLALSVVSLLGGVSLLAHRIASCVIGTGAVVLIGLLARTVSGDNRAGLTAAAIAAIYPPFITADGLVMSEPLFVLTVTAALLIALRLSERPSLRLAGLLGAVIGLATLTRGEGLLLVGLLAWPAAFRSAPAARLRRVIATAAAATAATALVLAPWVVRNAVVFHHASLAADANTLIAGANCADTYYGHDIGWWSLGCLARARTPAQLRAGDASTGDAFRFAGRHLTRLPLIAAVRVLRTFNLFQPLRQGNREPRRQWLDVVGLCLYFPVLVLAVCGLRRMKTRRWHLLAPIAMVVIVSALGWGIGRFRVAADVSLITLAALAVSPGRAGSLFRPDR